MKLINSDILLRHLKEKGIIKSTEGKEELINLFKLNSIKLYIKYDKFEAIADYARSSEYF